MELYLDTSDVTSVKRLSRILPLSGVTTNPSIVATSNMSLWDLLPALRDALGGQGKLFAQVLARDANAMVDEAHTLLQRVDNLVVKIPVTSEGLAAIKLLSQQNIAVLGTAVHSSSQGFMAALAGAEYIAPYVSRVDAQGGDGPQMVSELHHLLSIHVPESKILAASFKSPRQVTECMLAGCAAITIPIHIADLLISSPAVDAALLQFEQDWQKTFTHLHL